MPRVYRKRYTKKKSVRRYRKRYAKRIPRALGSTKQKVFYFTRYADMGTITATSTSTQYGGSVFSLSDVPNFGEFTTLFDFYKIKAIKLSFIPASDVTVGVGTGIAIIPNTVYNQRIFTVIDYNDAGIPASINELRQYKNCKWSPNNKIHTRYFKPRVIIDAGSVNNSVEYRAQPWVKSTQDLDYYAIKWAIENTAAIGTQLYRLEAKFYLAFKSPI